MPELGKATYWLEFNTAMFDRGLVDAEARANAATSKIAEGMGVAESSVARLGPATQTAAGEAGVGFSEMGAAAQTAATESVAASSEMVAASERTAVASSAAAKKTSASWVVAGKESKKAAHGMGLVALGAAYLIIKNGVSVLKANQQAAVSMNQTIKATAGVAGVTAEHASRLAEKYMTLYGSERSATLGAINMLLHFKNVRNELGQGNQIFDRTSKLAQDIFYSMQAAGKHVMLPQIMTLLGKAMNDPVKNMGALGRMGITFTDTQKNMVKALIAANNPLGAQKYLLSQLSAYTGQAAAHGKTLAGQLDIMKNKLGEASAQMLSAWIPTMRTAIGLLGTLAGWMGRHKTLVKDLILAWLAFKAVMVFKGVIGNLVGLIAKVYALRTAEAASAGGVSALRAGFMLLGSPAVLGAVALLAAGMWLLHDAAKAVNNEVKALDAVGSMQQNEVQFHAQRVQRWKAAGYSQADAEKKANAETLKTFPGTESAMNRAGWLRPGWRPDGFKMPGQPGVKPLKSTDFTGGSGGKGGMADVKKTIDAFDIKLAGAPKQARLGLLDLELIYLTMSLANKNLSAKDIAAIQKKIVQVDKQIARASKPGAGSKKRGSTLLATLMSSPRYMADEIALARAQANNNKQGIQAALTDEDKLLRSMATKVKKGSLDELALWQQISMVDAQITRAAKKKRGPLWRVPAQYRIAISKAATTASLKDDMAAYEAEKKYLQNLLKQRNLSKDEQARIYAELARVDKKLIDLKKKANAAHIAAMMEVQHARDLRGTFFGQFAPTVFHKSDTGYQLGGNKPGVTVNQHNHYHEIPKDRHHEARRQRKAVEGALA